MAAAGLDWPGLDSIWISHFHLDHVGGLPAFLQAVKHAPEMQKRKKPLKIFGPSGLSELIEKFSAANNYRLLELPFPAEIIEIGPLEPFEIASGIEATAMKTPHTKESLAIHIRDGEETLVFSADTAPDDTLATLANRVGLFILECTYFKNKPVKKHLELSEAMHLIRKAKPKRAMLTHFYPEWDRVDFQAAVAEFSPPCEVVEAVDGLEVLIGGEPKHFSPSI